MPGLAREYWVCILPGIKCSRLAKHVWARPIVDESGSYLHYVTGSMAAT